MVGTELGVSEGNVLGEGDGIAESDGLAVGKVGGSDDGRAVGF